LGAPLGQIATEGQKLEVSAVIPQVSAVEFPSSSETLAATEEAMSVAIDDTAATLGVSATTYGSQTWMQTLENEKWQRRSACEISSSQETLIASQAYSRSELSQKCKTTPAEYPGLLSEDSSVLHNGVSGAKTLPAGSVADVCEHALRSRRGILSSSALLNHVLPTPTRRFSAPNAGPSTVKVVKKVSTPGLKSVEDVMHERKCQALARLDVIPPLRPSSAIGPPSTTLAQLTAGLMADQV
jgi:hypothetical protein